MKSGHSYAQNGKPIFDSSSFINSVKNELLGDAKIMINVAHLNEADFEILMKEIQLTFNKKELSRMCIIDPKNTLRSLKTVNFS